MKHAEIIMAWISSCKTLEQYKNLQRFVYHHPLLEISEKVVLSSHILNMMKIKFA